MDVAERLLEDRGVEQDHADDHEDTDESPDIFDCFLGVFVE